MKTISLLDLIERLVSFGELKIIVKNGIYYMELKLDDGEILKSSDKSFEHCMVSLI